MKKKYEEYQYFCPFAEMECKKMSCKGCGEQRFKNGDKYQKDNKHLKGC